MTIKPEYQLPREPIIMIGLLPNANQELLNIIQDYLRFVRKQCERVVSDVALFELCFLNESQTFPEWKFLAARDGAMALRNFAEGLKVLRALSGRDKDIIQCVDIGLLKETEKDFQKTFPHIENLRHAVAHPEFYPNPEKNMKTIVPIVRNGANISSGATIQESFFGARFVCSIDGAAIDYEVSPHTAKKMVSYMNNIYAGFAKLSFP